MYKELYLATRYLFWGKAKHISFISIISCVGVALGVAALITVISVMNGFDKDLMERLLKFNYHINIECLNNEELLDIKEIVSKIEGVENVSEILQTQVFAKFNSYILPLFVRAIDFEDYKEKELFFKHIEKNFQKDGFFIGEALWRKFYIKEKFYYFSLDDTFNLKSENLGGIFKFGIYDIDNNFVVIDLKKAKKIFNNYTLFLGVRIKNPFLANYMKEKIVNTLSQRVFLTTWIETNRALFSALKLEKLAMFVILSLIILVASFNIFATLTVKIVEKTKDIGILKALGFTNKSILLIFSLQGLFLGLIGVIFGAIFGIGLCLFLQKYPFIKLPEEIYAIEYLPVLINYRDILLIVFLGLFLSFISSFFPALRASKLSPCEALRYG